MRQSFVFFLLVLSSAICVRGETYHLVWEEQFKGKTLDTLAWSIIPRYQSVCCRYTSTHPRLYSLRRGRLRLYGRVNDGLAPADTARYLTGGIWTRHKRVFTYGKIEVRARMKGVDGCWPAVWTKNDDPRDEGYPKRAEIDILEYCNRDTFVHYNVHNNYTDKLHHTTNPSSYIKTPIRKDKWNVYTLEILPDSLIYSVNGRRVHVYPRIPTAEEGQYPFGTPSMLMIDMQIGSPYLPPPDHARFPPYIDVDWVRMYQIDK